MNEYSDVSLDAFNRALESLLGEVPEALHEQLATMLEEGTIHDPTAVMSVIRSHLGPDAGGD